MKLKIIVIFLLIQPLAMANSINTSTLDLRQDWAKQGDSFNPSVWCYDKAKELWDKEDIWVDNRSDLMKSYEPDWTPRSSYRYMLTFKCQIIFVRNFCIHIYSKSVKS